MKLLKAITNVRYRSFPGLFWRKYSDQARKAGITGLYFILSYDCDTDEDVSASLKLYEWLSKRDIPATFAVPGSQLEHGRKEYKQLDRAGAHFINHGGAAHTRRTNSGYESTTFYSQMASAAVVQDIQQGHKIFSSVFGRQPNGFRAPHFGHFQKPDQLAIIYDTLNQLGSYQFSSTTTPRMAAKRGPVFMEDRIWELPVLGSYNWPLRIFDSWGHRQNRQTRIAKDSYAAELRRTVDKLLRMGLPAVLNYYADPSHISENKAYFEALEYAKNRGVTFSDYYSVISTASAHMEKP